VKLSFAIAALAIAATVVIRGQSTGTGSDSNGNIEDVIRQLHVQGVHAQLVNDIPTLDRLWADDHTFTNPLGVVQTKAERIAEMRSGARTLSSFNVEDIQVRVYGNTAVVTSRATIKGQLRGSELSTQARGIDVYVKKEGRWRLVAAQATRIAQP
jgi:ketosteroid isomerase-like protein